MQMEFPLRKISERVFCHGLSIVRMASPFRPQVFLREALRI
jgi:hypothetical protein